MALAEDLAFDVGGSAPTKALADLIDIVRKRGDMRNTNRFPDSYLTTEIQAAFAEGYELVVEQNQGFYDLIDFLLTEAGTAWVPPPNGMWILRALDRQDGQDFVPMPRVGIKDRNRYGSTQGKPGVHRLTARGIDLFPTPDAVYTLRAIYTPVAPVLGDTAGSFYNSWEEYAVYGALVRCFNTQGRDPAPWQQQLDRTAARIIKAAGERDSSGPEYLNLREGIGAEFSDDNPDVWQRGF